MCIQGRIRYVVGNFCIKTSRSEMKIKFSLLLLNRFFHKYPLSGVDWCTKCRWANRAIYIIGTRARG